MSKDKFIGHVKKLYVFERNNFIKCTKKSNKQGKQFYERYIFTLFCICLARYLFQVRRIPHCLGADIFEEKNVEVDNLRIMLNKIYGYFHKFLYGI